MPKIYTDAQFLCPALRSAANTAAAGIPDWAYLFVLSPKCIWIPGLPQELVQILGASHMAEIPFVFGYTQNLSSPSGTCDMSQGEQKMSEFMGEAWTSMATHQRPSSKPSWPQFKNAQQSLGVNIASSRGLSTSRSVYFGMRWKEA